VVQDECRIRPYSDEDGPSVMQIWNDVLTAEAADQEWYLRRHRLTEEKLTRITGHPNYEADGALVCEQDGAIVAYGRAAVRRVPAHEGQDVGALPAYLEGFAVERACRGRGLGTKLLEALESFAARRGKDAIQMNCFWSAIAPASLLPGSSGHRFLLGRGYEDVPPEMELRLTFDGSGFAEKAERSLERVRALGFDVRYYEDADRESFSALQQEHFAAWWYDSYRPNLERPEPRPVLVAVEGRKVVGFVGFVHVGRNGSAGFTPGVHPQYRRRGIATALLNLWASEVKKMGAVQSTISTNVTNPAQHIYFGMGYKKLGEFTTRLTKRLA
jgi:ribosomal protein S18 acetylase RimI-like enzyme